MNKIPLILFWIIYILFQLLIAVILLWGLTIGYLLLLISLLSIYFIVKKKTKKILLKSFVLEVILFFLFIPLSNKEYNKKSDSYFSKISRGDDLDFVEKLNVYNLNIGLAIATFSIFPEISKETFCMIFPAKDRTFKSDFFLKSKRINYCYRKGISTVNWKSSDFYSYTSAQGYYEARASLALNPCKIHKELLLGRTKYTAVVNVNYYPKAKILLIPILGFYVEEGLFNYLEKEGWLNPYYATYYCYK